MRYIFTKADRLLKRNEFIRLSRVGKKIHTGSFLALYQQGAGERTRLGITVTKKVTNAPGRNRIKRLVRESFRLNRHSINGCWDINIVAKQKAASVECLTLGPIATNGSSHKL